MRLRNIKGSEQIIATSPYVVQQPILQKNKWQALFGNQSPIYLEIGMGKGKFLVTLAKRNPHINYIGIEKYTSVMLRAIQKLEQETEEISNLRLICMDAEAITEVFEKEEISRIYLNFSDPWPKDRHARRRLPSKEFLERYDNILKSDGQIEFKTDNRLLFDFAVEELKLTKWKTDKITYHLHQDSKMMKDNVMTEYEEKFSTLGNPIHKYIISR